MSFRGTPPVRFGISLSGRIILGVPANDGTAEKSSNTPVIIESFNFFQCISPFLFELFNSGDLS